MAFLKRVCALIGIFTLSAAIANAQDRPIGYWESHLPYNIGLGLTSDGNTIYSICPQAFFTLNGTASSANPEPYSKVEGMSDMGMQYVAYDLATSTAVLVYTDGNIDLFKDNTFYNVPDLKVKTVAGNKTVNQVYTENGLAYLSTSLGVIVLDLTSHNILETFQFSLNNNALNVTSFIGLGNYFYAATSNGLYRADKNNPALQNSQVWTIVDSKDTVINLASVGNTLFIANSRSVFALAPGDTVQLVYTCSKSADSVIEHIDGGSNSLFISEFHPKNFNGDVRVMNASYQVTDTFNGMGDPKQVTQLLDNSIWLADAYYGLAKIAGNNVYDYIHPNGPTDPYSFDIYAHNKNVWVVHGGFNDLYYRNGNRDGVSNYVDGKWKGYNASNYPPFDTLTDFVSIVKDEASGTVYLASFQQGLFMLKQDGSYELANVQVFDSSDVYFDDNQRQVTGVVMDQSKNLWVTTVGRHQLYRKSAADGTWSKYQIPTAVNGGTTTIDDNNQVWFSSYSLSGGLTVFNTADTTYRHLTTGTGTGNLPSNKIFCLAKDKNNQIWVGTDNGIGIISGCDPTNTTASCDANIPIVQYDQFAGYLFAGNNVRTIAVDGANRKWVGTDNGVWLLSPDASKIVYRFTQDNSPLPSNNIEKIGIDAITGDVYIGTLQGLVTYRSTATEGGASPLGVIAFPNPVASGYSGSIAIKGLVANADVRITDVDGQLVYKTKAFGGQAVWNGLDYTGHRPQSGVYLIFASGSSGSQTYQGKIVFLQ